MTYASYEDNKDPRGNSKLLLVMHGMMGSKSNWNSLSKVLNAKTSYKVCNYLGIVN